MRETALLIFIVGLLGVAVPTIERKSDTRAPDPRDALECSHMFTKSGELVPADERKGKCDRAH